MSDNAAIGYSYVRFFGGVADGRYIAVKDGVNLYRVPRVDPSFRWFSEEDTFVPLETDDYTRRVVFSPKHRRHEVMALAAMTDDQLIDILNEVTK